MLVSTSPLDEAGTATVMTERVRSQVQASEMRFLQRIEGVTLFNKVRELLLLRIERSPLRLKAEIERISGKTPQTSFTCQSKWEKANWTI